MRFIIFSTRNQHIVRYAAFKVKFGLTKAGPHDKDNGAVTFSLKRCHIREMGNKKQNRKHFLKMCYEHICALC